MGFGSGPRGVMESLWRLKRFDAFPKTLEDFRVKTCGGALGERGDLSGPALVSGSGRRRAGCSGADGGSRLLAVTAVSGLIMVLLFFSELQYYLTKEVSTAAGVLPHSPLQGGRCLLALSSLVRPGSSFAPHRPAGFFRALAGAAAVGAGAVPCHAGKASAESLFPPHVQRSPVI